MKSPPDFETIVDRHSAEIFGYLWRMLRDTPDAEDCLQDTFLRAYKAYPRLQADTNHRAWLYKIATNAARTHLRQRGRFQTRVVDLDPDLYAEDASLPDRIDRRQQLIAVAQAVEALPDQQRAALIMRKYQELSYDEIAGALDCTEAAARANVYQALKKLREQFDESTHASVEREGVR